MKILEQATQHEARVMANVEGPYCSCCRRCKARGRFSRHDVRRRNISAVEDGQLVEVRTWIVRWKCVNCLFRFTDYPPFALPYRRCAKATLFEMAAHFCQGDERSTYRSTCVLKTQEASPLSSESNVCSHSSLWRWLSWLHSLQERASECLQLLEQWNPRSTLHRCVWGVSPLKYRSEARGDVVRGARRSLNLTMLFENACEGFVSPKLQQHSP